jgi:vacuolar protein sorting-associated protein 13A/C
VAVESDRENIDIGVCDAGFHRDADVKAHGSVIQGRTRNAAVRFGVPLDCLGNYRSMWEQSGVFQLTVGVYPIYHGEQTLKGSLAVSLERRLLNPLEAITTRYDVACCSSEEGSREDSLVFQVLVVAELVNGYPVLDITFQPRATLENSMPIPLQVQTPMPHTYSESIKPSQECTKVIHSLNPGQRIEIFTPGPSIAVTMKCKDLPVAGTTTDWMEGWVDLPLVSQFRLPEPLICSFPFARNVADPLGMNGAHNTPFLIAEGSESLTMDNFKKASAQLDERSLGDEVEVSFCSPTDETAFFVTVYNYAVDHTGDILIEQVSRPSHHAFRRSMSNDPSSHMRSSLATRLVSAPLGAFSTTNRNLRVSLLPETDTPIRILQLTMEGDEGLRKGTQFCVDDIAICDGGALSTPMYWEDGRPSGYFAYRKLVSLTQSEVHIVPEYIVFNGSESRTVRVKQPGGLEFRLTSGNIGALKIHSEETAAIAIEFESGARTALLRVDSLGLRMAVVKSYDGHPIGSIALQTVVGGADSRLVVKLGELKLGSAATLAHAPSAVTSALDKDFLRIRVQCSQLSLTLIQAGTVVQPHQAFMESALDRIRETASPGTSQRPTWFDARSHRESSESDAQRAVCTVLFHRFTIDWQRVFKDDTQSDRATAMATRDASRSIERSQLSVIIHNVQLRDETPGSAYPIVFDSTSNVSFFDLCVRFRGSLDSELVKIDLFDLNLAHGNGESKAIVVNTSEEFIWHLLDVTNRIIVAAGEFVGVNIELKWDDEHGGYTVKYSDKNATIAKDEMKYTPPKSDTLYDINQARVSPFTMLVSFKRIPQSSRYKRMSGVPGANIINYFTTRLKFKIDRAELKFSRYEARNIKGPPDHLLEMLSTVYLSRMKLKLVSIMTAASFQDWKKLAARDGGDDEFVEGDLLRVTGNIAGNSVSYILKKAGMGLGQGISSVTHALGDGIENATDAIGARAVGAGVNSLVSGVGDGVGGALSGGEYSFALRGELCRMDYAANDAFSFFSG